MALASRLQAKQKEVERLIIEIAFFKLSTVCFLFEDSLTSPSKVL